MKVTNVYHDKKTGYKIVDIMVDDLLCIVEKTSNGNMRYRTLTNGFIATITDAALVADLTKTFNAAK